MSLQANHQRPPFVAAPPRPRGLTRLRVVPPPATGATLESSLDRLTTEGLVWTRASEQPLQVVGGTSSFVGSGVRGFDQPFEITQEDDGEFSVFVAATRGFGDTELRVPSLMAGVEAVLSTFRERGILRRTVR